MPSSACDWSSDVCSSDRSEEHTSELQSRSDLVCRLLLEKKKTDAERATMPTSGRLAGHIVSAHSRKADGAGAISPGTPLCASDWPHKLKLTLMPWCGPGT